MALRMRRRSQKRALLLDLLFALLPIASAQTTYYIDNAPGYSDLPSCAYTALGGIVQDKQLGCDLQSSYGCFCSQSSSHFNSVVSREVTKTCHFKGIEQAFATSAQEVFAQYCALGAGSSTASSSHVSTKVHSSGPTTSARVTTTPQIDLLPDYNAIAGCAKLPLSYIVKDMISGCGHASAQASFHCFCHQKSSSVNSLISANVQTACDDPVLVGQAQVVFSEYCDLGSTPLTAIPQVIATPTSLASTGARPSAGTASITQNRGASETAASSASTSSGGLAQSTVIAIAVCIPVVILGIALACFLLWRRRRRDTFEHGSMPTSSSDRNNGATREKGRNLMARNSRTASDIYTSKRSSSDEAAEPGAHDMFTPLPPLADQDEEARVAPLVPARSPLRPMSRQRTRTESTVDSSFVDSPVTADHVRRWSAGGGSVGRGTNRHFA